jgi:hypothetical protein
MSERNETQKVLTNRLKPIICFNLYRVQTQKIYYTGTRELSPNSHIFSIELFKLSHKPNSFTLKEATY